MTQRGVSNARIELCTPAKINLGLRITGRRDDGYHLLESVFLPIGLEDDVTIDRMGADGPVELDLSVDPAAGLPEALAQVSAGSDNLVVRTAEAFREATGIREGLRIGLCKRIPSGAGLGGGSSDAGAVLVGLSRLFGEGGSAFQQLDTIALGLGADVPYFLAPTPARVTGIGERIEPLEGLPELVLVVANVGIFVATAEVYRIAEGLAASLTDPGAGSTMRAISRLRGETGDWGPALGDLLVNDLEPAAIRLCPPIGRLLARMRETGALGAGMSGSGGTVFGIFPSPDEAASAAESLRAESMEEDACWVQVTRSHPAGL